MTTGHIVEYDAENGTYSLPAHRASVVTRAAGPNNLALVAQFIPLLSEVEQQVVGCFRDGGGVPYSEFPRFHTLMAEMSGVVFDAALVNVVLPLVDGLPDRLRSGVDVADFGCGSGHAVNVMARRVSGEPIHRCRLLRGRHRGGNAGGGPPRSDQRDL